MPPTTILLEPDAYERLAAARRSADESLSDVVRRAVWPDIGAHGRGADIVAYLNARSEFIDESSLDAIEKAGNNDAPPLSPWLDA